MILCKFIPYFLSTITLLFLIIPCVTPLSFRFPNFTPNDDSLRSIATSGDANITNEGIELTANPDERNASFSVGRATYTQTLHLWDANSGEQNGFTTHFTFLISSHRDSIPTGSFGEGFVFFLSPNGSNIPPNSAGGGLGLGGEGQEGNFVAIEFDTYRNEWESTSPINHIGININSMESATTIYWPSNTSILRGIPSEAWISYNPGSTNLSVALASRNENDTGLQYNNLFYRVNLTNYLPEWVDFGFSAATGQSIERNIITSWEFNPRTNGNNTRLVVGLSVGLGLALLVIGLALVGYFLFWKRRNRGKRGVRKLESMDDEFKRASGPKEFQYSELSRATNNFAEGQKLGEGGFGGVYQGILTDLSSYVAVKRVSTSSQQGVKEYKAEVITISRLRHKNLVQLIGWCHEKTDQLLLVYEYMANRSLDYHLFRGQSLLKWDVRYKIAQGLASALLYLQEEGEQCVLHRDIKSSNVMLDSNFNAKLGDFGLAKLMDDEKELQTTTVAGTKGYIAPEYMNTGRASKESDVFSFGVVALEIACGRKPIEFKAPKDQVSMVEWVWELYGVGMLLEGADPKLSADFDKEEMEHLMIVGLWCSHPDPMLRPSIRQANLVLNFESPLPNLLSKRPGNSTSSNSNTDSQSITTTSGASSTTALL